MEIWKPIENTEYTVSNKGRIKNRYGKLCTTLKNGCAGRVGRVSIIVAKYFMEPPKKYKEILINIDGDKTNNNIKNLKWITRQKYNDMYPRSTKGKTQKETYSTSTPTCGYQKGKDNIAKKKSTIKKISKEVKKSYTPKLKKLRSKQAIERLLSNKFYNKKYIDPDTKESYKSTFEIEVKSHLIKAGINYKQSDHYEKLVHIGQKTFLPDFTFTKYDILNVEDSEKYKNIKGKQLLIEVSGSLFYSWQQDTLNKIDYILKHDKENRYVIVFIVPPDQYHIFSVLNWKYHGRIHVFSMGTPNIEEHCRTLINTKITNIDYMHLLPWNAQACKRLHGHSSSISVKIKGIFGIEHEPWILDFKEIKKHVKDSCENIDHKLLINKEECKVVKESKKYIEVKIPTPEGLFEIKAPKQSITLTNFSTTAENLSFNLAKTILHKLPHSIFKVEIILDEGLNNGAMAIAHRNSIEVLDFLSSNLYEVFKYHVLF